MFHWNSLDTTKHGCKSATQPMFRKCRQVFQPAGSLTPNAQLKPSRQPPKPSPSIQHHTRKYQPATNPATHMHSCQQQWNSHPAPVQGSTQSAPHKRQWKTPWTKSVNHPNASDQPNQPVKQNRTNAPQCSPQLTKIAQIRSKPQLKPRKNTQKHRKARFCSSKVTFCACYPGKW